MAKAAEQPNPIEFYEVRAGMPVPIEGNADPEQHLKLTGHVYPSAVEVLQLGSRRVVVYAQGVARAWHIAGPAVTQPHAFTEADIKAAFGSYMVYRLKEVLTPDEEGGWPTWAIVVLVGLGVLAVLAGIAAYLSWDTWDMLRKAL